ncbi:hypothetical protein LY78DRAFT_650177 [Colletotrichum sublineola]|nr:hypothetical protein LY78DRAFT_650177 [Colletotrichum sublineola]
MGTGSIASYLYASLGSCCTVTADEVHLMRARKRGCRKLSLNSPCKPPTPARTKIPPGTFRVFPARRGGEETRQVRHGDP